MDFADIQARKKAAVVTAWVLLEPGLEQRYEELQEELVKARQYDMKHNERDTAPAIQAQIEEVEGLIADARVPFTFRALGRKAYNDLLAAHKPKGGDKEAARLGFDPDTFPPALIAASSLDPMLSIEDADTIWHGDDWSDAEATMLWNAAFEANRKVRDVPFTRDGIATETLATARKSITQLSEESLTAGS